MKYRCPICKRPTESDVDKDFPFCSERCRLTDLGNWATEKYKVTERAADDDLDEKPQRPRRSGRPEQSSDENPHESEE
ncbi:MAG TPA: DNA gyrase inhibitor YacG [Candidatus Acidoferrales bacterium]|nr:DNA gyrase inhibitor YacG [Candidatus Acidoferrales bacterium]